MNPHKPTLCHFSHHLCEGIPVNRVTLSHDYAFLLTAEQFCSILVVTVGVQMSGIPNTGYSVAFHALDFS